MKEEQAQTDSNSQKKSKDRPERKPITLEDFKTGKLRSTDHIEEIWAEIRFR